MEIKKYTWLEWINIADSFTGTVVDVSKDCLIVGENCVLDDSPSEMMKYSDRSRYRILGQDVAKEELKEFLTKEGSLLYGK
jgi:hypothetical protein